MDRVTRKAVVTTHELRALVVVVDEAEREVAVGVCREFATHVDFAADGSEALSKHQENPFDLIITDCEMIGINGWALANEIRSNGPNNNVPILALSVSDAPRDVGRSRRSEMSSHLVKPLPRKVLQATVLKILGRFR